MHPTRPRMPRWLAAAAPVALLSATLALPAAASVGRHATAPAAPASALGTTSVTLITGDTVRLTSTGAGRYTAVPGGGNAAAIAFEDTGNRTAGVRAVYAIPADAAALVTDGSLDRNLFDVTWLADHGAAAGPDVVVQYAGHPTSAWLLEHGAALAGARVTGVSPQAGTVTVQVSPGRTSEFWAALSGQRHVWTPGTGPLNPRLAGGISRAWLAGHQSLGARQFAGQALYTVTETITRKNGIVSLLPDLLGVSGAGADTLTSPVTRGCVTSTCSVFQLTFRVPEGVYEADDPEGVFVDLSDITYNWIDLTVPQFAVTGDTNISIDANNAREITISTPRPSVAYTATTDHDRTLADGTFYSDSLTPLVFGAENLWVVPTTQPVTIGSFHYDSNWTLGSPPLTMSALGSKGFTLHPMYVDYNNHRTWVQPNFLRFSGHQVRDLVAAGTGTKQDFSKVNARGKLVLLKVNPGDWCGVWPWQLQNARQAGAAGILFDPRDPTQGGGICPQSLLIEYKGDGELPWVRVPAPEAAKLDSLLAAGPVRISLTDGGQSPYIYNLKFFMEGRVSGSGHYTVTDRNLAQIDGHYHAAVKAPVELATFGFRPNVDFLATTPYGFLAPFSMREYYGPVNPDVLWYRFNGYNLVNPRYELRYDVFATASTSSNDWWAAPLVPGTSTVSAQAAQARPNMGEDQCSVCTQDGFLLPSFALVSGANPRMGEEFTPDSSRLFTGSGAQVPATTDHNWPAFPLPAKPAWYRLVTNYKNTSTSWKFKSAPQSANTAPAVQPCIGTIMHFSTGPCAAQPLIFLRYDASTSLSNTVTAPGTHTIQVTPYYQAVKAPARSTGLRLWTSTDGGKTWQAATVHLNADGSYTAGYRVAQPGSVSIKAQATDSAGDTVTQIIRNAYQAVAGR